MTRENRITVRFSDEEIETIRAKAEKSGLTASDYLRASGLQESNSISCGSEILAEIKEIHEDADKLYLIVQEYYSKSEQGLDDLMRSGIIEGKILEQNQKLRYITKTLEELDETLIPPYEDLPFSEYRSKSKIFQMG